jgi:phage/plasmid-associated DNA primase
MMLTNVKPEFDATDLALIDRLNFIPFPARFEKTKANTEYIDSLTTEYLDQFFTLFCEGAQKWFSEGEMMDSKICIDGKIKYKEENDTFRDFINMNVVEHKGQNLPCKDLFNAYKSYCLENDIRPDAFQKFNNRVETEFYKKESINRVVVFLNCRFVNSDENKINPML